MNMPEKNWLEWTVFAAGMVLVAGVLGHLTYDAVTCGDGPPIIEVRLGDAEQNAHNFSVPVKVMNHGDTTAEGVHIEVTSETGDEGEPERSDIDIPFVPRGATREGWVTFQTDPRAAQLKARVLGYQKP